MDCVFSDPQDYQGNSPTNENTSFAFHSVKCDISPLATLSAQTSQVATTSAISYTPALQNHLDFQFWSVILIGLAICFFMAFKFGSFIFRR
jgi:hypothetical protein